MEGTHATRVWKGAVNILGSTYNKQEAPNQMEEQKLQGRTASQRNKTIQQFFSPNHKVTQQDKPVTPSPQSKSQTSKVRANEVLKSRQHSVRLMIALKIGKQEEKTPNNIAMEQVKDLLKRYQKNNPMTCIVPWKVDNLLSNEAIMSSENIPSKIAKFIKRYMLKDCIQNPTAHVGSSYILERQRTQSTLQVPMKATHKISSWIRHIWHTYVPFRTQMTL
jgi:hypothetical protein